MKRIFILLIVRVHIILILTITVVPIAAQDTIIENRVFRLETTQNRTIEQLKENNDQNSRLITLIGGLFALLVTFQIVTGYVQYKREGKREEKWDVAELGGVEQVSKVMDVVQRTLEGRLAAEKEARDQANQAKEQYEKVVKPFEDFYRSFQVKIQKTRRVIEDTASLWASKWSRHHFRDKAYELNEFAREFEKFRVESEPLEENSQAFTSRVYYIRGIAAHYANQPDIARKLLEDVVRSKQQESDENENAYNRRIANANYYLGIIQANFSDGDDTTDAAIKFFEKANVLDLQRGDFLTRIVTAEAYIMKAEFTKASSYITEVEEGLREIENREGHLKKFHLRLRSRTLLIKANIAILKGGKDWRDQVKQLLKVSHIEDPQYYFAIATLAQVSGVPGDLANSKNLFHEAYQAILIANDLNTVREVRSRILLLMVAGMCSKNGSLKDQRISDEYLDEADNLRISLPTIDTQVCTVFSPLSKRNESAETIGRHIDQIRQGKLLV